MCKPALAVDSPRLYFTERVLATSVQLVRVIHRCVRCFAPPGFVQPTTTERLSSDCVVSVGPLQQKLHQQLNRRIPTFSFPKAQTSKVFIAPLKGLTSTLRVVTRLIFSLSSSS